jgi:Bacterial DNA-binding protein
MATIGNLENMPSVLFQPLETIMAKKKPGKADTSIRVIKETLTKSALINLIAEQNDIPRKTAIGVFNTLESVMLGSVHPRGVGEFTLPGLCKITLRKVPARKCASENPRIVKIEKCRDILISGACKEVSIKYIPKRAQPFLAGVFFRRYGRGWSQPTGCSRFTSNARLSSRRAINFEWRRWFR